MAPPPPSSDVEQAPLQQDNWAPQDEQPIDPSSVEVPNGAPLPVDDDRTLGQGPENPDYLRGSSADEVSAAEGKEMTFREKQVKPNKVYIGGLPEHTTQEDLQSCFGKIGTIVNIELKIGYGFVEFDTREAAEESVAKYHEGYFMGNKIRVELSRGGGRTAKFAGDPGACFKCGQMGHWARECPNHTGIVLSRRPNMPPRDDMMGRPPARDVRYDYPPPRDYRRPPSPREYREYGHPPPGVRGRDYDDYRRGPPMPERDRYPPPHSEYRGRYPSQPDANYRGYGGPPPPPPPAYYDRYERRPGGERYPPGYVPPGGGRPRTPPRYREDFERMPPNRDFDYRGRPPSPPPQARYDEYRGVPLEQPATGRYKRRSESPPRSYDPYPSGTAYGNNYPGTGPGGPPPSGAPPRSGPPQRDYIPPRNGLEPNPGYRRH